MYEHGPKKQAGPHTMGAHSTVKEAERRGADRHSFTASADVIELSSGARFSTRTTDLGPGGCFVDTMTPFPVGAKVRVTVKKAKSDFQTEGTVVYSQTGLGMGIAFAELNADQRLALQEWLTELTGGKQLPHDAPKAARVFAQGHGVDHATLVRLVQLMISKGILTEAEGSSVLLDPLL
jgi:PilZ domain